MSRFGLGNTVNKTIHKYPANRYPRVHLLAKVRHQYPRRRFGSRNGYLDTFESLLPVGLTLDSIVVTPAAVTIADVTPFVVTVTVTHTGDSGSNDILITAGDLAFDNGGDVEAEFPRSTPPAYPVQIPVGDTVALQFTITPDVAPTNGTVDVTLTGFTAEDETTADAVVPTGTPTDDFLVTNETEATLTTLSEDTGGTVSVTDTEPEFNVTLRVTNSAAALANDLVTTAIAFIFTRDAAGGGTGPEVVTSDYTIGTPSPALGNTAQGAFTDYVFPVTISDAATGAGAGATNGLITVTVDVAGTTFEDAVTAAAITETDSTSGQAFEITA